MNNLDSLRYREVQLTNVIRLTLWISLDQGVVPIDVPANAVLSLADGSIVGEAVELAEFVRTKAKLDPQDIVNASGSEDHYSVSFGDVEAGEPFMRVEGQALCLQMNTEGGGTAPAPIISGMLVGQAALQTGDVALEHGTYDSVPYSSGIAEVGDRRLHLVVAETPEGRRGAIKFAPRKNDA